MKALSWTNFALGLWLVIAPFVLLYRGIQAALWDDVVVGLLIAAPAMRNNVIVGAMVTILTIWLAAHPWRHQHHRAH